MAAALEGGREEVRKGGREGGPREERGREERERGERESSGEVLRKEGREGK